MAKRPSHRASDLRRHPGDRTDGCSAVGVAGEAEDEQQKNDANKAKDEYSDDPHVRHLRLVTAGWARAACPVICRSRAGR